MIAELVDSSAVNPKFMVPRPIRLTSRPERPTCPYAISSLMPEAYARSPARIPSGGAGADRCAAPFAKKQESARPCAPGVVQGERFDRAKLDACSHTGAR